MSTPNIRDAAPQLIFGGCVILIGLLFLLDNLNLFEASRILDYWFPGLLMIAGAIKLLQSRDGGGTTVGALFFLVGLLILLDDLNFFVIDLWDFWPVLLVAGGLLIIWRGFARERVVARAGSSTDSVPGGAARARSSDSVSGVAIFGGFKRAFTSQDFQGANLTAFFGGCELDLRDASISAPEAIVDVFAFCGGIDLKVPEDWVVELKVLPVLGGAEDKTRAPQGMTGKRLIVRGTTFMGGVGVKN